MQAFSPAAVYFWRNDLDAGSFSIWMGSPHLALIRPTVIDPGDPLTAHQECSARKTVKGKL
jgi:hypothetical protein